MLDLIPIEGREGFQSKYPLHIDFSKEIIVCFENKIIKIKVDDDLDMLL